MKLFDFLNYTNSKCLICQVPLIFSIRATINKVWEEDEFEIKRINMVVNYTKPRILNDMLCFTNTEYLSVLMRGINPQDFDNKPFDNIVLDNNGKLIINDDRHRFTFTLNAECPVLRDFDCHHSYTCRHITVTNSKPHVSPQKGFPIIIEKVKIGDQYILFNDYKRQATEIHSLTMEQTSYSDEDLINMIDEDSFIREVDLVNFKNLPLHNTEQAASTIENILLLS